MSSGNRDANRNVVLMGVSSVDGVTPVPFKVDPTTGKLLMYAQSMTGGVSATTQPAKRDGNRVPILMGVNSSDGSTPIPFTVYEPNSALRITGV